MHSSRRGFLKAMGAALGTVVLSSCGSGSSGGYQPPLPNGYRYYKLFSTGDGLAQGGEAVFLPPSVKIHDNNQIIFHAGDTLGRSGSGLTMGLYEICMDYGGGEPRIEGVHKIVRAGDTTTDGRTVLQVQLADLNTRGSVAVRLLNDDEQSYSLYLERSRRDGRSDDGLQRLLGFRTPTPDPLFIFGAALGNFDLTCGDDLLVAAHWCEVQGAATGESLFHLPFGVIDGDGTNLLTAGAAIPGTDRCIGKIGLVQANDYGAYVAQVHTMPMDNATDGALENGTVVLTGSVADNGGYGATPVAASAEAALSTATRLSAITVAESLHYGPRIGSDGKVALVAMITDDIVHLTSGGDTLAGTGHFTPTGMRIEGIGGPVPGPDGLVYFLARNGDTEELLVSNGYRTASLLKTGARLFVGGPVLTTIAFGYARKQVDSQGRLVFVGEFDDGSLSIMLGIPL